MSSPEPSTSERFREHMAAVVEADPAAALLVVEAARIMDRLDHLDSIITGKSEWIQLMHFRVKNGDAQEVAVSIDGVLSEARQQVTALKGLLAQLGVGKADMSSKAGKAGGPVDPVDVLAARRAARGAGAAPRPGRTSRAH